MNFIELKPNGIKIPGHIGTWYVISQRTKNDLKEYLLEHEIYGEDTAALIVDECNNVLLENVFNGFKDLDELRTNN